MLPDALEVWKFTLLFPSTFLPGLLEVSTLACHLQEVLVCMADFIHKLIADAL